MCAVSYPPTVHIIYGLWHARLGHIPRKISAACALFLKRKGTICCTVTASRHFSTVLPQGDLVVHVDIPQSTDICAWVLRITSCFIIAENLICRFFMICQIAKLKSSPNFPAIRYNTLTSASWPSGQGVVIPHTTVVTAKIGVKWCMFLV